MFKRQAGAWPDLRFIPQRQLDKQPGGNELPLKGLQPNRSGKIGPQIHACRTGSLVAGKRKGRLVDDFDGKPHGGGSGTGFGERGKSKR